MTYPNLYRALALLVGTNCSSHLFSAHQRQIASSASAVDKAIANLTSTVAKINSTCVIATKEDCSLGNVQKLLDALSGKSGTLKDAYALIQAGVSVWTFNGMKNNTNALDIVLPSSFTDNDILGQKKSIKKMVFTAGLLSAFDAQYRCSNIPFLLKCGANPNAKNTEGVTPLMKAALWDAARETIDELLRYGADAGAKDNLGFSVDVYAKWHN